MLVNKELLERIDALADKNEGTITLKMLMNELGCSEQQAREITTELTQWFGWTHQVGITWVGDALPQPTLP